jgi:hypothetical protein
MLVVRSARACVQGCCVDSACACRHGYVGATCGFALRCALIPQGGDSFQLSDPEARSEPDCVTVDVVEQRGGARVVCACRQLGMVAVLKFQIQPASNLDLSEVEAAALLERLPVSWWLPLTLYVVCMLVAADTDSRDLYQSAERVPFWLCPRRFSFRTTLLFMVLTRSSVLRIFYVFPDHVVLTRTQLLQVPPHAAILPATSNLHPCCKASAVECSPYRCMYV